MNFLADHIVELFNHLLVGFANLWRCGGLFLQLALKRHTFLRHTQGCCDVREEFFGMLVSLLQDLPRHFRELGLICFANALFTQRPICGVFHGVL